MVRPSSAFTTRMALIPREQAADNTDEQRRTESGFARSARKNQAGAAH